MRPPRSKVTATQTGTKRAPACLEVRLRASTICCVKPLHLPQNKTARRIRAQERQGTAPARIVNDYDTLPRRVKKEDECDQGDRVFVKTNLFVYDG